MSNSSEKHPNSSFEQNVQRLEFLRMERRASEAISAHTIPLRNEKGPVALSYAQQRIWFLHQMEPDNPQYNIPKAFRIKGALDLKALQKAITAVFQRHESLRTLITENAKQPIQQVAETYAPDLSMVDLRHDHQAEVYAEAESIMLREAKRPFDLSRDLPCRFVLLRLASEDHILLIVQHHIASDGWSTGILLREISQFYDSFCAGGAAALPDLPIQYADFALWQRQYLQGPILERQLSYWKQQLAGYVPFLQLPTDRPRPPVQSYRGSIQSFLFPKSLLESLQILSRQQSCTLFMTLLAAFNTLLYRYTGQQDIIVGSPIAGRTQIEIENLIGFFVNTLALRSDLSGNPSFRQLLIRVRKACLQAYAHQDLPFEKLVEELKPERNLSYSPFFQVMLILQNAPSRPLELLGLHVTPVEIHTGTAKFDLTLSLKADAAGLHGNVEFNTDLFDASTIQRLIGHFQTMLEAIGDDLDQPVGKLPLLTETERHQILIEWNNTQTDYPRDRCIHQLFEAQVEKTPDATALAFQNQKLTYRELDELANQLAQYLRNRGVCPDVLVGICMERSLEMIVGLIGILKAGGCCLPLDPAYPKNRLAFMSEDSRAKLLLIQEHLTSVLEATNTQRICLDSDWETIARETRTSIPNGLSPEGLVYALYTSGSTGTPKGVAMCHRTLCNLVSWQIRRPDFRVSRTLQFAPLSFDVSFQEIFTTLCSGGTLILIPEALRHDPEALTALLLEQSIERLFLPFVALQQISQSADRGWVAQALQQVIVAGEQLQITSSIAAWFEKMPRCTLENQYGPSESHVATAFMLEGPPRSWPALPPIGRPIDNTRIYILDSNLQPVPVGVIGELFIGGDSLAQGYLNRPDLTAERFIMNPFSDQPGDRLYRTGDLARYLPDGNVQFAGRNDEQVKIRGFRIELGEIESVLRQHEQVEKAAVKVCANTTEDKRLIAYIVPNSSASPAPGVLRAFLKEKLPEYMVPSSFVPMNDLPLTPSGKVDRLALPVPESKERESETATYIAPRNRVEAKLAGIWQELLGLNLIGIRDNFFEIGGHSLLAIKLFGEIEKVFGKRLPLTMLFQDGTIERLAGALQGVASVDHGNSVIEIKAGNTAKPLFLVHGLGGELLSWQPLMRHLKTDAAIYGLQPPEQNGLRKPFSDLKVMAREYVDCICSMHIKGPCSILGYSYGGKVALEIAQQLKAKEIEVDLLAIIDTGPVTEHSKSLSRYIRLPLYFAKNLPFWIYDDLIRENAEKLGIRIRKKLRTIKKRIKHFFTWGRTVRYEIDLEDTYEQAFLDNMPDREFNEVHFEAWKKYKICRYPGRVTLFRSRTRPLFHSFEPDLGWSKIALGGVDIKVIPGHHLSIMREPNIRYLAYALQEVLESRRLPGQPKTA